MLDRKNNNRKYRQALPTMRYRLIFTVTLICLIAFSMALPGRDAKLRAERRRQRELQKQREREQTMTPVIPFAFNDPSEAGDATWAFFSGAFSRYDYRSKKETYLFIVNELNQNGLVRQSMCRVATTRKTKGMAKLYVGFNSLDFLYEKKKKKKKKNQQRSTQGTTYNYFCFIFLQLTTRNSLTEADA